ncbi:cytochrome P450 2G1-like [Talpa occidentalis]|uniref:cytochrome P450 2G1-like n=1 Tax=Talpa occidentalis TaxID=50954 RepID=UPI0023F821B7|nr:cytochrome P450 2G1-like [Talpa occidentalis]XP_054553166.1 cytochrome P450 2G1-like [Talpa occidentalis]XP_054553167.1 cytochrome P450 2G1-like [Talpa occidentalis]XP_054553168.1 cytochrome P450 2G1-like [Talpa occidentalis]XP_054553169.1 cytochrome P450 2G1-like [Talpa occidentalis]XP_054553170.1 cytochrome P450 2G1-like [Talpa occidentalis]
MTLETVRLRKKEGQRPGPRWKAAPGFRLAPEYQETKEDDEKDGQEHHGSRCACLYPDVPLKGIAFSQGKRWRTLRRFALTALRDLGLGRRSLEERIQEEVGCLEEELEKTCGMPFDPTFPIRRSISNIICSVVFGRRFDYQDEDFKTFLWLLAENLKQVDTFWVQIYSLFPALLRHLPGPHNRLFEVFEKQKEFVARVVKEHEVSLDPAQPRDFIDAFLIRMQQEQGDPHTEFNQENLLNSALDIFFAGMETTSTTLRYGLLILLKYPQITELIQQEIDRVVGPERRPCLGDRPRMPYTEAVLHEILRFADIIPLGVPHAVTQDTQFRGYHIPKGTMVFPMLHSVLNDSDWFQDPSSFQPERFLDASGAFQKNPAFLPFSAGRRACPGESLARTELFLYLTWLLQRYSPSSLLPPATLDLQPQESGFGKQPPPFQLILQPRQHLQSQAPPT